MGLCISTPSSSSKVKHNSETPDISTSLILPIAPPSTPTSRELSHLPMLNNTSRRTVITSTGVHFRSTDDLLEEASRQLMMLQQRH
ncbi:C4 protein [Pepper yellow dwarf virus - Mexico]|uniref:C4 protein n=1 Tax=Pepper yellow dwarf virus - Mexico TaxID=1987360 RepID=UPI000A3AC500|nr:C4 protein [Pepper yellow dwarf virus - Mexico]ARR74676.1 C4 protein [Pepper yellow dwarf virus - Mexico]